MLKYLLILFVIALALAPLGHFLPSKRQRKSARMREYAAVHGMFVEFRPLPDTAGVPLSSPITDGQVIYYGRRLPNKRRIPVESGTWVRAPQGWRSVGAKRLPIPESVAELPENIGVISVDQISCGVYWTESQEDEVEQIRQVLERWSEALIR